MTTNILEIIDADKKARQRVAVAYAEAVRIKREARADMKRLEALSRESVEENTKRACAQIKAEADEQIAGLEKEGEEKRGRMDQAFKDNGEAWKKEILSRILDQ